MPHAVPNFLFMLPWASHAHWSLLGGDAPANFRSKIMLINIFFPFFRVQQLDFGSKINSRLGDCSKAMHFLIRKNVHQCLRLKFSMPFKRDLALQNIPLSKQPFKIQLQTQNENFT
jgi:hypothetical protein